MRDGAVDGVFGAVYFCVSGGSGVVGEVMGERKRERMQRRLGREKGKEVERECRPGVDVASHWKKTLLHTSD